MRASGGVGGDVWGQVHLKTMQVVDEIDLSAKLLTVTQSEVSTLPCPACVPCHLVRCLGEGIGCLTSQLRFLHRRTRCPYSHAALQSLEGTKMYTIPLDSDGLNQGGDDAWPHGQYVTFVFDYSMLVVFIQSFGTY